MSSSPPNMNELFESLTLQAGVLIQASQIEGGASLDKRDEFTRQQLRRASVLVKGAVALGTIENSVCLGILSRSLLEQLITTLWGIRSVENTESQMDAGPAELAKALKMNLKSGTARMFDRTTGEDVTANYLESEQAKQPRRRKNIEDQAREAEVQDLYTVFYRLLSLETHGHSEPPTEQAEISALCITHLQGIGAISRGIGQACVWWLMHRTWPDNESLRDVLGLNTKP
ncbi:DUF5677 domain-containing protein [Pseudomonas syringae group sp. 243L2]|uniref:DUF5677 domain-containing protein n=1 Tax=Pseudomonas syringae group sp. 243L2 TaxID=3079593 RepID=UPI0029076EE1|nr:DUF5677 domain-containing protein [Pseudomonas syringae group sp. 243L2]MDU8627537.1 hypothetical protein [Pseudomonas syringae group sp. 243L2]